MMPQWCTPASARRSTKSALYVINTRWALEDDVVRLRDKVFIVDPHDVVAQGSQELDRVRLNILIE